MPPPAALAAALAAAPASLPGTLFRRARAMMTAPGRLWALGLLAALVVLRMLDPDAVQELRLRGFDLEQRLAPRVWQPVPVRIVAIDDDSLARYGQWPWPRTLMARLVDRIAAAEPRALGIDILFPEPDRLSPPRLPAVLPELPPDLARQLAALPASEARFAAALRQVPAVLGLGTSNEGAGRPASGPTRMTLVREAGGDPRPFLPHYAGLVRSLPELTAAERGRGVLAGEPDSDGIVRRVPLMVVAEGRLVPSLDVEMLRLGLGQRSLRVDSGAAGIEAVVIGGLSIPTDARGRAYPCFTPALAVRYVSAASLLDGSADPNALHGALVLLGVTGLGLVDVKQTPLGLMQGVEVRAQLLESILSGSLLRRPAGIGRLEELLVVLAGLTVVLVLPFGRPRLAGVALGGLLVGLLGGEFLLFRVAGLLVDAVYPALSAGACFALVLGANYRAAEAARRRLAADLEREREQKARLAGELNAAKAIQMGLLPRRFPAFPGRADLDLFAVIEPARTVGGDLYDYFLIDDHRLFLAIADVSGKGVPAALFMAMTKEVLRAAVLRHGAALDRALEEANDKIAAASADMLGEGADMMFVTVLAGVLDLATGVLAFASAGHDAPFSLLPGQVPRALNTAGGPPLGAVEGFPFPVETHQLTPGETLLLFTDGVTEAETEDRSFYGLARLERAAAQLATGRGADDAIAPHALLDQLRDDLRGFVGAAEPSDDITFLAVRWTGPAREASAATP